MSVLDLLRSDGSIVINKTLAHLIGLNETVFLAEVISLYFYYKSKEELDDGWFYATIDRMESNTTLKKDTQNRLVKRLVDLGFVSCQQRGIPSKRYFRINEAKIMQAVIETKYSQIQKPGNKACSEHEKHNNPNGFKDSQNANPSILNLQNQDVAKCERNNTYLESSPTPATTESSIGSVMDVHTKVFGTIMMSGLMSDFVRSVLNSGFNEEFIKEAMLEAGDSSTKPNLKYLKSIVSNWIERGISTRDEAKADFEKRRHSGGESNAKPERGAKGVRHGQNQRESSSVPRESKVSRSKWDDERV